MATAEIAEIPVGRVPRGAAEGILPPLLVELNRYTQLLRDLRRSITQSYGEFISSAGTLSRTYKELQYRSLIRAEVQEFREIVADATQIRDHAVAIVDNLNFYTETEQLIAHAALRDVDRVLERSLPLIDEVDRLTAN